jgi:hypothetical protein
MKIEANLGPRIWLFLGRFGSVFEGGCCQILQMANPTYLSFLPSDKLFKSLNLSFQFGYFPQLNSLDGEHH